MIECCPLCGSRNLIAVCETCDHEVWASPGRKRFSGYRLRDYDHTIATLAASRECQGISLSRLAEHTDCAPTTLSENLRSRHRMDVLTLLQVAGALGFDLALIPKGTR
jgi:DNA-binding phage protein